MGDSAALLDGIQTVRRRSSRNSRGVFCVHEKLSAWPVPLCAMMGLNFVQPMSLLYSYRWINGEGCRLADCSLTLSSVKSGDLNPTTPSHARLPRLNASTQSNRLDATTPPHLGAAAPSNCLDAAIHPTASVSAPQYLVVFKMPPGRMDGARTHRDLGGKWLQVLLSFTALLSLPGTGRRCRRLARATAAVAQHGPSLQRDVFYPCKHVYFLQQRGLRCSDRIPYSPFL
jgi:hypothetical protein